MKGSLVSIQSLRDLEALYALERVENKLTMSWGPILLLPTEVNGLPLILVRVGLDL